MLSEEEEEEKKWAGQVQGMILDTSEEWQVVEGQFCQSRAISG